MPSTVIDAEVLAAGIDILTLLTLTELVSSRSEGRRLIEQGGLTCGEERVDEFERIITADDFNRGELVLRRGKKVYHRVVVE